MSDVFWGFHLLLDCGGCDVEAISNRETIINFTKDLVKRIDMVAFGEPVAERFATHDPAKAGFSMYQLIETSNLSAHFVERDATAYFDVFSCKPYDIETVIACVKEYFGATNVRMNYITRQA
jgi:S-adenosylmethionine/arginine decarboxylase-like enzyme